MNIELTEEQQRVLDSLGDAPPLFVDPRTNAHYVLVPQADFESIREMLSEERRQRAIRRVALRNAAGRMGETP